MQTQTVNGEMPIDQQQELQAYIQQQTQLVQFQAGVSRYVPPPPPTPLVAPRLAAVCYDVTSSLRHCVCRRVLVCIILV
jgi:hypothetical protein